MRVAVAMSGGVDSSVAAYLLHEAGHEVIGVFMSHGVQAQGNQRSCCSAADAADARRVAGLLNIPFYALDFQLQFHRLIDHFSRSYASGLTPNPCVLCNQWFKFGELLKLAEQVDAQAVATGHYGIKERYGSRWAIRRARDTTKDQSYVLFSLSQYQLERTLLPLGELTKAEVREQAQRRGLPVANKAESQEICFVPSNHYVDLVSSRHPEAFQHGDLINTRGEKLGEHKGIGYYTIGQRKGLGIALGKPAYVVAIDAPSNTVVIGDPQDLNCQDFTVGQINWVAIDPPQQTIDAQVQIRAHHQPAPASLSVLSPDRVRVVYQAPQRAVTPGQAAVFYRDHLVLGGGWIEPKPALKM